MSNDDSVSLEVEFIETRRFRKRVTMCRWSADVITKSPDSIESRVMILGTPGETIELSSEIIIDTFGNFETKINEA